MNKLNINTGLLILSIAMLFTYACGSTKVQHIKEPYESTGIASYYADSLHGNKTASGERYDKNELTAAHPWLPFGTRLLVTNLKNGRTVEVRVNDRGPFIKGRIIDLSRAAAKELKMIRSGITKVTIVEWR